MYHVKENYKSPKKCANKLLSLKPKGSKFANGIKKESLISIVFTILAGPVVNLYFAIYGTRLSWRYKQWSSWKSYQDAQKKWIYASYVFCCVFVLAFILALILINV